MNIYEKAGDFLVNTAQLIIGGVILTNVIKEDINGLAVYFIGTIVVLCLLGGSYVLFRIGKKRKK